MSRRTTVCNKQCGRFTYDGATTCTLSIRASDVIQPIVNIWSNWLKFYRPSVSTNLISSDLTLLEADSVDSQRNNRNVDTSQQKQNNAAKLLSLHVKISRQWTALNITKQTVTLLVS